MQVLFVQFKDGRCRHGNLYRYLRHYTLQAALAWLGCFLSILLVGGIFGWVDQQWSLPLMLASFGPTAALLYGSPKMPAAQPWKAMGEASKVMLYMFYN